MSFSGHTLSASFLGNSGERFLALEYLPSTQVKGHVVYIPPLGEEMNRCRALVATQARRFADAGYSCTVIDLFGTGDSEGELHHASLERWYNNIELVVGSLLERDSKPITLWGLRLGGLLALGYCARSAVAVDNVLLWQPISSSKRFVTQLLRQRIASLVSRGLPPETTKGIRQRLNEGECVEISGYLFGGLLLSEIESIQLSDIGSVCSGKIAWLEQSEEEGQALNASAQKMVESLQQQGNRVDVLQFNDPPIWQLHKRDHAPHLLQLTEGILG